MEQSTKHNNEVISQFTQQAVPFTKLSGNLDSIDLLIKMSAVNEKDTVLDVASGPGLVATAFAKVASHVECLDLTPAMLDQAKQQALTHKIANMSFREGDAMTLPYEDNSFDTVITRYSFHHFLTPEQVLSEMIRVCKPKGCVLVADVAIESKYSVTFNHIERLRDSSHVHALSIDELNRLFTQSNLKDCRKSEYTVNVELEQQLQASFPTPDDKIMIRKLITDDVGISATGFNPELIKGNVHYSYPISIYVGIK